MAKDARPRWRSADDSARVALAALEAALAAELRFLPEIDELRFWIEEYRVSLYAQELKTLAPVSAARLRARAETIEAWLNR